jgi:hypothetical protein
MRPSKGGKEGRRKSSSSKIKEDNFETCERKRHNEKTKARKK